MSCLFNAIGISLIILVLGSFPVPFPDALLYAQGPPVSLQVSFWQTENSTKRDLDRLKLKGLSAKFTRITDAKNNIWYIVYIDSYKIRRRPWPTGII